jgi:hypothetical protein
MMNQWLIPIYGITGSAIATASIVLVFNVFRTIFVWIAFGMFPFSLKNVYVLLIGSAVFGVASMMPKIGSIGSVPNYLIDTPIRSLVIFILFGGAIYFTKISSDVNNVVNVVLKKIRL